MFLEIEEQAHIRKELMEPIGVDEAISMAGGSMRSFPLSSL
jgi:hypothetical protein